MSNKTFYRLMGAGVAVSALATLFIDPRFAWLTLFMGAHTLQHTYTGFCLLQKLLKKGEEEKG